MTAQADRGSRRIVRLGEGLLESWVSGNPAYDALDDDLRRLAVHLGLLRETVESGDSDEASRRIDMLEEALAAIRTLVHRLEWLDGLRRRSPTPERVVLRPLVERVVRRLAPEIEESEALVVVEDLPTVWASADDLEVLFSELLTNAVRFRGDAPLAIRVATGTTQPDWAVVTVSDTGSGFSSDYRESVFEAGVVLLRDGMRPGAGIGLTACRLLAERNRGSITAESTPGEGATFAITLPSGRPATAA